MKTEGNLIQFITIELCQITKKYLDIGLYIQNQKTNCFIFTVDFFHQLCLLVPIQIWPLKVFQIGNM
jgi:hypothetical protein